MGNTKALVKIHLYSGRRNPEWFLTEKDTDEFLLLWDKAAKSKQKYEPVSKLGYAGCFVFIEEKKLFVYNGLAVLFENNIAVEVKEDVGKKMEKLLIGCGPGEVRERVEL